MNEKTKQPTNIEQAGEDLFNYAIDREEVKWLMASMPEESQAKPATVEYELQILKIISVGWGITYFMSGTPKNKLALSELLWQQINAFSKDLSETTGLMIGQDIDYFTILKERLDFYVAALSDQADIADPNTVIGPVFARQCGHEGDIFAAMVGAKMFHGTVTRVRQYLEALKLR